MNKWWEGNLIQSDASFVTDGDISPELASH